MPFIIHKSIYPISTVIPKGTPENHLAKATNRHDTVVDSSSIFSGAAGSMAKSTGFVASLVSCGGNTGAPGQRLGYFGIYLGVLDQLRLFTIIQDHLRSLLKIMC